MRVANGRISLSRMDSSSIVQMTRSGDRATLCELIERYRSLGRRTAFAILKNREDAEGALQEASLRAFLKFSTFEGNSVFQRGSPASSSTHA